MEFTVCNAIMMRWQYAITRPTQTQRTTDRKNQFVVLQKFIGSRSSHHEYNEKLPTDIAHHLFGFHFEVRKTKIELKSEETGVSRKTYAKLNGCHSNQRQSIAAFPLSTSQGESGHVFFVGDNTRVSDYSSSVQVIPVHSNIFGLSMQIVRLLNVNMNEWR